MKCKHCDVFMKVDDSRKTEVFKWQLLECPQCLRRIEKTEDYQANVVSIEPYPPKGLTKKERDRWWVELGKTIIENSMATNKPA